MTQYATTLDEVLALRSEVQRLRNLMQTPLSPVELRIVDRHLGDWVAFRHAWNAIMKRRLGATDEQEGSKS